MRWDLTDPRLRQNDENDGHQHRADLRLFAFGRVFVGESTPFGLVLDFVGQTNSHEPVSPIYVWHQHGNKVYIGIANTPINQVVEPPTKMANGGFGRCSPVCVRVLFEGTPFEAGFKVNQEDKPSFGGRVPF